MRWARAAVVTLVAACGVAGVLASSASAGGGGFSFDRGSYEPGDQVVATTPIWDDKGMGGPDDGPYGVWILPLGDRDGREPGDLTLARQIERARYVGDLTIDLRDPPTWSPHEIGRAHITFELPEVPAGPYGLLHCNYPCTTWLIPVGSHFWVGAPPIPIPQPPVTIATNPTSTTTTTAAPVVVDDFTARAVAARSRESDGPSAAIPVAVALVVVGGITASLITFGVAFALTRRTARTG